MIVTHSDFGKGLVKAAEAIVGKQEQIRTVEVSPGEPLSQVKEDCLAIFQEVPEKGVLVLVDMVGGTPCNVVLPLLKDKKAEILTGVNLYMLLTALSYRGSLDLADLAARVLKNARNSVADAKALLQAKLP